MTEQMKKGQVILTGDRPMQIFEAVDQDIPGVSDEQKGVLRQVGATVKAYLKTAEELLNGKYAHLKDWVPVHLANPGKVLVACCPNGVVIRYESGLEKPSIFVAWFSEDLPEVSSLLSQNLIHCYSDRNYTSTIPATGTELNLFKEHPVTKIKEDIVSAKIGFDAVIERPERLPQPPLKPFCLLSVRNTLEMQLLGELIQEGTSIGERKRFLARSIVRLPVGWECIEIFPFFDLEQWKPEYTQIWGENDLLAAVVARQFREAQLQSLDPNAATRRGFEELLKSYKDLLASDPEREEILQRFLRDHPALLCPAHIKVWPKLALGARETDFVFREATGDYLLVELERSTLPLFLKNGHQSRHLTHAQGQAIDWKRYLEDNLSTVQRELGLDGISTNPRSLIVIGRSKSLAPENRRKLITIENAIPKLKIITYDDIYENAKAIVENLLGPLWAIQGNMQIYYLHRN